MSSRIVIAGFADDVALVTADLAGGDDVLAISESGPDISELSGVSIAVYVFSSDTGYSSQLLSRFAWIHHHAVPKEEYLLGVGGVDVKRQVFDVLKHVPVVTVDTLRQRLAATRLSSSIIRGSSPATSSRGRSPHRRRRPQRRS